MNIFKIFIKSLYSVKTLAAFRFQRMGKAISYVFVLSFLVSLPSISIFLIKLFGMVQGDTLFNEAVIGFTNEQLSDLQGAMTGLAPVIAFLSFLFIFLTVAMIEFVGISLVAAIGLSLKQMNRLRLTYQQLWVMSAHIVTLPSILIALSGLLPIQLPYPLAIYFLLSIGLLYVVLRKIPKPKIN